MKKQHQQILVIKGYYWFRPSADEEWKIIRIRSLRAPRPEGEYDGPLLNPDQQAKTARPRRAEVMPLASKFFEHWNSMGKPFKEIMHLGSKRVASIAQRSEDKFWTQNWQQALLKVQVSEFCRGENDRAWVATPDWFLRPESVMAVMEGKYDARAGQVVASVRRVPAPGQEVPQ